jgi:transposase-like protein
MDCPKCKSKCHVKDGFTCGRQRYKCKECQYRYTVKYKSDVKPSETRRLALELYLEGLGFRSIGRILNISYGTVYLWVKEWRSRISLPRRENPVEEVELEKLFTHIESKKSTDRHGLLLIDLNQGITLLSLNIKSR